MVNDSLTTLIDRAASGDQSVLLDLLERCRPEMMGFSLMVESL